MKKPLGLCLAALLLTACGAGGGTAAPKVDPAPTPSPTHAPAESADCRGALGTVGQILDSMEAEDLAYEKFTPQAARVRKLQKRAATTCTPAVSRPLSMASYRFALAAASWSLCDSDCNMVTISRNVHAGQDLLHRAVSASERTS